MELIELLAGNASAFIAVALILGLLIGSFLNVVIHRLPLMMEREWREQCAELDEREAPEAPAFNLVTPRSRCPHCGHAIGALENVPLISYLSQRGRCRGCGEPISMRYPIIELCAGLLAALAAWHFGWGWAAAGAMLFAWALLALTMIDVDHQLLPDDITLPLLWLGLLFNLFGVFTDLESAVIGAMAGYMTLWLVFQGFKLLTGKEGMGFGDFKLLAVCGAWMGWKMLPVVVLLSSVVGAVFGILMILLRNHAPSKPIPFGPYLAGAGLIALYLGDRLIQAYLDWAMPANAF